MYLLSNSSGTKYLLCYMKFLVVASTEMLYRRILNKKKLTIHKDLSTMQENNFEITLAYKVKEKEKG